MNGYDVTATAYSFTDKPLTMTHTHTSSKKNLVEVYTYSYDFAYDELNRLTAATHSAGRFTEKVSSYDKNGDIKGLQRYGQTSGGVYGLIDNLTYTLDGNRLNRVDDAVTASAHNGGFEFKDGVKQADEYAYDANGNLTKDLNKGIGSIQYNCLNLPTSAGYSSGGFSQFNCKAITGRD